jgi:Dolichyl-phosphate-mannose-protein mannosyltransferase
MLCRGCEQLLEPGQRLSSQAARPQQSSFIFMTDTNHGAVPASRWWAVPAVVAVIYFALHMLTATRYGYFRDAFYYLACSEHLDWGYVDQPPLIVFIAWIARHTLGTSLRALLFWPALAGAGRILLISAFARELGAKRFGIALAATLAAVPGVWWALDHQFAMNAFEALFWTGCAFVLLRLIKTNNPRLWLAFGAIAGLGMENKYSIAVFAFALLIGLALTPQRKLLWTPWLLAGAGVALLIFAPNLIWNIQHHWPFLELMRNIRASGRMIVLPPGAFLLQQILITNPLSLPFWFSGLLFLFLSPNVKPYRALAWGFVFTIGFFLLANGKNYYSAPAYGTLLAAGAVLTEKLLSAERFAARPWVGFVLKPATLIFLITGVLAGMPLVLPILPVEAYLNYQSHLPFALPHPEHSDEGALLPQHYADEFGWEELVAAVARVYYSLPENERAKAAILTNNFGEAGAIDFFGPQYGLPKAICGNQSYFLWGPRNYTGEIVIRVGSSVSEVQANYESVVVAATIYHPYSLLLERRPILICRGMKGNLQALWPTIKDWHD